MSGMNLHALASPMLAMVHPPEWVTLYPSDGQANVRGRIVPTYKAPVRVLAQVQSVGDAALTHADKVGQNSVTKHFYLFAEAVPAALLRPLGRGGDMILRGPQGVDEGGTWWLATAMPEDFAPVGWVCLRCTLQINGPDLSASPAHAHDAGAEV